MWLVVTHVSLALVVVCILEYTLHKEVVTLFLTIYIRELQFHFQLSSCMIHES